MQPLQLIAGFGFRNGGKALAGRKGVLNSQCAVCDPIPPALGLAYEISNLPVDSLLTQPQFEEFLPPGCGSKRLCLIKGFDHRTHSRIRVILLECATVLRIPSLPEAKVVRITSGYDLEIGPPKPSRVALQVRTR
jgi:hypothetical protein